MTDEEWAELGRRAVACRAWRWMPGMRMLHPSMGPARVLRVTGRGVWVAKEESLASGFRVEEDECGPDLRDPATLGCLLALVREVGDDDGLHVRCMRPYSPQVARRFPAWMLYSGRGQRMGDRHMTEVEALVAALEAAP